MARFAGSMIPFSLMLFSGCATLEGPRDGGLGGAEMQINERVMVEVLSAPPVPRYILLLPGKIEIGKPRLVSGGAEEGSFSMPDGSILRVKYEEETRTLELGGRKFDTREGVLFLCRNGSDVQQLVYHAPWRVGDLVDDLMRICPEAKEFAESFE